MMDPTQKKKEVKFKFPNPHTFRRKVIWKGKMAPKGSAYYVVTVKVKTRRITKEYSKYLIMSGELDEKQKNEVVQFLRQEIFKKFNA